MVTLPVVEDVESMVPVVDKDPDIIEVDDTDANVVIPVTFNVDPI